jgi:Eco57I restriction-modification methylase
MDKALRNTLRNIVTQCRKLLEEAVGELLQGQFGIHADGKVEDAARLTHLSPKDLRFREEVVAHLEHIKASGQKPKDAAAQLIREAAFTHLNRLCAYKMMTSRGLIKDPLGKGLKSRGFLFYLADHPADEALYKGAQQDQAYRNYLDWLNDSLSSEIGVLFAREDLATRLFPPYRVLIKVLELINSEQLASIWSEDETIGWVYQYFTPKELRERSRREHPAPQNSYELAFRNQFYTPRYVVEFLVDNTLGRLWYEMRKGETTLVGKCRYLVRHANEVFLLPDEKPPANATKTTPDLSPEEPLKQTVYVQHREKKDLREIKILDPACGSGHFLLYCFGVLEMMYEEAYQDSELGPRLKSDFPTLEDLKREVPRLILEHNLHGIDIDLRSTQISALALWLRCQRAYGESGLKNGTRPPIRRTNIVCAEPMPGERELLEEFAKQVYPPFLGEMVRVVFEKMKLAGEAGSLLKIEEQISDAIAQARAHWRVYPKHQQLALFRRGKLPDGEQGALFDLSGITDEQFWQEAEARVIESLRDYAQSVAHNGMSVARQLFAEDAAQGFAFVDVCRKRFDVVLMNPPFGNPISSTAHLLPSNSANNIYAAFVLDAIQRGADFIGAITDRTFMVQETFKSYRRELTSDHECLDLVDLGWEVLDTADVQVAAYVIRSGMSNVHHFLDVKKEEWKEEKIKASVTGSLDWAVLTNDQLAKLPNRVFAYSLPPFVLHLVSKADKLMDISVLPRGLGSNKAARTYKAWYEVPVGSIGPNLRYQSLCNGGDFSPFYREDAGVAEWIRPDGRMLVTDGYQDGFAAYDQKNTEQYFLAGLSFPKQSTVFNVAPLPEDAIPTREGKAIIPHRRQDLWFLLAYLNSSVVRRFVDVTTGLHKQSGAVGMIPIPSFSKPVRDSLAKIAQEFATSAIESLGADESSRLFLGVPKMPSDRNVNSNQIAISVYQRIDEVIADALSLKSDDRDYLTGTHTAIPAQFNPSQYDLLAYSIGCSFGRWDVRYATGERCAIELRDPFAPLPVYAPGALIGPDDLPPRKQPVGYPLRVAWDGILVDDLGHEDDVVRRARAVFEVLWPERADEVEREACELLDVKELRDYFRRPGAGGFWMDHVKRYSKSRRKAPIYWLLRSSKGNYSIWLYYHRLDRDILYKALLNYVEPKMRLEESNLDRLRRQHEAVGTTGREAKQVEKELEGQESLLSELHDFHDKLTRAADLRLEPDLNDGVVLNIAPLWELVPWSEAKKYWNELLDGKYEWSSIGKQLHERGKVAL